MTVLKNREEIRKIRESGEILRYVFSRLEGLIKAGVSTAALDKAAEAIIRGRGAEPAFKGYRGYPSAICASVNEVVVHGIPSDTVVLSDGDIIGLDIGVKKGRYYTDAARTYTVGKAERESIRLIEATKKSLEAGIKQARSGRRVMDISSAIENVARKSGFQEVRVFVGHGTGLNLHESPEVPNWGQKGTGVVLREGLVLAIEPMLNAGTRDVEVLSDGWTAVTRDRKLSAHFENTVIVGKKKAEILT